MDGYYSEKELKELGLKSVGTNVLISKKASIYLPERIKIGNNVRIDDFSFLVGNIELGNYIHIAPYVSIHGTGGGSVTIKDFSAISGFTAIYASTDDYSGNSIANPTVDDKYEKLISTDIIIESHVIVGLHCVILPHSYLAEGVAMGAMSMLYGKTQPWYTYIGVPCKKIKKREMKCKEMAEQIISKIELREGEGK